MQLSRLTGGGIIMGPWTGDATTAAFNEASHPTVTRFYSRKDGQGGEPKEGEDDDIVTPAVWGFVRSLTLSLFFSRQNTTAYICLSGLDIEAHVSGRERVRKSKKAHSERAKALLHLFPLLLSLMFFFVFFSLFFGRREGRSFPTPPLTFIPLSYIIYSIGRGRRRVSGGFLHISIAKQICICAHACICASLCTSMESGPVKLLKWAFNTQRHGETAQKQNRRRERDGGDEVLPNGRSRRYTLAHGASI
ncbi:hypothetical protein LZ31DRAFT_106575 [Colletotrichum somersetense]|nr:hypothetical protein LZ31DRAFT_106575 [Colletotrichum somersetense]